MIVDISRQTQLAQCGRCNPPANSGVGALTLPSFDLSSIDWKWIVAIAAAAFLIWRFAQRRSGGSARRQQMRLARAKYQMELAK